MPFQRILYFLTIACWLVSCSTKQNTVVSRGYHNLTARYNGYYYSTVNMDEGIYKTERSNKENFEKILPIYVYPTPEKAKVTFPEFDKAIKKSSLSIQKHAIKDKKGNEIPTSGKWIDNNWINIGISHFYKREFFSAIETFEYVARTYTKSNDKYTALLWLIKANNEIGAVSSSDTYLSLLKNEKNLPKAVKKELPVVYADYYIRRGQYTEAIAKLLDATRNNNFFTGISKKKRARYSFIIAQLSEMQGDLKRATQYYNRTIHLKPAYEMVFYSKIKLARMLDVKKVNSIKVKKDLLKMTKEFKNSDYYDVIYFTLGDIEEKEKNLTQAQDYYKKSVRTSVNNTNQKALSFLRLAEINFDLANYQPAEAYYDSTIATLPVDHPDYNNIIARKKTLESLVTQITTISREDSLQRIAKMSEADRNKFIDKMIENFEKEEERKRRMAEDVVEGGINTNTLSGGQAPTPGGGVTFYFYNPTAVAFGVADFVKKWGNRKNEDNWRRSNKAMVIDDDSPVKGADSNAISKDSLKKELLGRDFYKKDLPLTDSLIAKSNTKIVRAYYLMGTIYKEELNNTKKTISTFEELNRRFPENKYALNTYYSLYRIYNAEKNTAKADYYKNKILTEFPESEFAQLIKNPDYAQELNAKKSEVEEYYATVFAAYRENNYEQAYSKAKTGIVTFGKTEYLPKFEFIKAMSGGKLKGIDTLEKNLKMLVAKYPESEVTPLSQEVLLAIKKEKNPEMFKPVDPGKVKVDTFNVNFESPHFVIAVVPDDVKMVETLKTNISNFNSIFFSDKNFQITSSLFGKNQLVVIKTFSSAKEAMNYYDNISSDNDIYKGINKTDVTLRPISSENLPFLYRTKNVEGYKLFYGDTYSRLQTRSN